MKLINQRYWKISESGYGADIRIDDEDGIWIATTHWDSNKGRMITKKEANLAAYIVRIHNDALTSARIQGLKI